MIFALVDLPLPSAHSVGTLLAGLGTRFGYPWPGTFGLPLMSIVGAIRSRSMVLREQIDRYYRNAAARREWYFRYLTPPHGTDRAPAGEWDGSTTRERYQCQTGRPY
jgi:hypothetical protein